jgi:hypothetical protein
MRKETYRENLPYLQDPMEAFAKESDPLKPTNQQTDTRKHPDHPSHMVQVMMSDVIIFRCYEETPSKNPFNNMIKRAVTENRKLTSL